MPLQPPRSSTMTTGSGARESHANTQRRALNDGGRASGTTCRHARRMAAPEDVPGPEAGGRDCPIDSLPLAPNRTRPRRAPLQRTGPRPLLEPRLRRSNLARRRRAVGVGDGGWGMVVGGGWWWVVVGGGWWVADRGGVHTWWWRWREELAAPRTSIHSSSIHSLPHLVLSAREPAQQPRDRAAGGANLHLELDAGDGDALAPKLHLKVK